MIKCESCGKNYDEKLYKYCPYCDEQISEKLTALEETKATVMQSPAQIDSELNNHYKLMIGIPIILTVLFLFGGNPLAGLVIGGIIDMGYYFVYLNYFFAYSKVSELRSTPYALSRKVYTIYELSGIAAKELAYINIIPECKSDEKLRIKYDGIEYDLTLDKENNQIYIFPAQSVLGLALGGVNYVKVWKSSCKCVPLIIYTIQKAVKVG